MPDWIPDKADWVPDKVEKVSTVSDWVPDEEKPTFFGQVKEHAKENLRNTIARQIGGVEAATAFGTGMVSMIGGLGAGLTAEAWTGINKLLGSEGYENLDPAEAFTITKEEIEKSAYQPRTEMGKKFITPSEMPSPEELVAPTSIEGVKKDYNVLARLLDPRRLPGAPYEIGKEIFNMPAESLDLPEWARRPGEEIAGLAAYPGIGKGFKGTKNLVRDIMRERIEKRTVTKPIKPLVTKPLKTEKAVTKEVVETPEEITARIQEELKLKDERIAKEKVKAKKKDVVEPVVEKITAEEIAKVEDIVAKDTLTWTEEDKVFINEMESKLERISKKSVEKVEEPKGVTEPAAVWEKMSEEELKKQAEYGVEGAKNELAVRKAKAKEVTTFDKEVLENQGYTTEEINKMSSKEIRKFVDEEVLGEASEKAKGILPEKPKIAEEKAKKELTSSGFKPTDNLFNNPKVASNTTYAWRSMGEKEFTKLMEGEKEYLGSKQGTKSHFLAGIPESAGQFGGKGKYLVEFGDVKILGDEGLRKGSKATKDNITKVWRFNNRTKTWEVVKDWEVGVVKKPVEIKFKPKEKKVVKTEVKVEEASKKLYDEVTTLDNKLTEVYENKNLKLIELKGKILEIKEPYKTAEGYYKNISLVVKDAIKGFEKEIKLLERTENNKIKQLQKKITEVERKIDKVEILTEKAVTSEKLKIDLKAEKKLSIEEILKDEKLSDKEKKTASGKIKATVKEKYDSKEITADSPIRFTNVIEVNHMLKTGENFLGKDAEGNLGISASVIPEEFAIVDYSKKTKQPIAIIYPKEAIEGVGVQPNEVMIKPSTKLSDLRFIVGEHKKLYTLEELRVLQPKVKKGVQAAEKAKRATEAEEYVAKLEATEIPRGVKDILEDINIGLGEKGAIGDIGKATLEQKAARKRLKKDFAQLKEIAREQGKNYKEYLKELGFEERVVKYYAKETPQDRIETLKKIRINKGELTEELYQDALKSMRIKAPKKVRKEAFLTKAQEKELISKMLKVAPIAKLKSAAAKGLKEMPAVKEAVDTLNKHFENSQKGLAITSPRLASTLDMHHLADKMQKETGKDFGTLHEAITHGKLKSEHLIDQEIAKIVEAGGEDFIQISKDPVALKRINDFIGFTKPEYVKKKPRNPKNITPAEKRIAQAMIDGFKRIEGDVRYNRFHEWKEHGTKIPNAPVDRLKEGDKILLAEGDAALREWCQHETWGVQKSGYDAGIVLNPTIKTMRMEPEFGKRGLRANTTIQYQKYEKDILRRYASYMRQMTNRTELKPLIDAWREMFEQNKEKFADPERMAELLTRNIREILGQKEKPQIFEELFIRLYSQGARATFMDIRKGVRNLFQNAAFYTNLGDALKMKKLSSADQRYFDTYVSQMRGIQRDWLYQDYQGLPGLSRLNKWADRVNVMGRSDTINRLIAFRMKLGTVKAAIKKHPDYKTNPAELKAIIKESDWGAIEPMERMHALELLARKGEDAMARYIADAYVKKVHFLYERFQRSPAEQGTELARVVSNLLTFRKGYIQRGILDIRKLRKGEKEIEAPIGGRKSAIKSTVNTLVMGAIASYFYTKLTGDKRAPYHPWEIISDASLGGLATGMQEQIGDLTSDSMKAIMGDSDALGRSVNNITRASDSLIPFYNEAIFVLEGFSGYKDIDKAALRQLRNAMDARYNAKPMGYYKKQRNLVETGQHIAFGTDKEKKSTGMKSLKKLREEGKSKNTLRKYKSLKKLREG